MMCINIKKSLCAMFVVVISISIVQAVDLEGELAGELQEILSSIQAKKINLLKRAEMDEKTLQGKTADDLIRRASLLREVARGTDLLIAQTKRDLEDPSGECQNLGFLDRRFDWYHRKSYCASLKPSKVLIEEKRKIDDQSNAISDLVNIKKTEKALSESINKLNESKLQYNAMFYDANMMPKQQIKGLKELDEKSLQSKLIEFQTIQQKMYNDLAEKALKRSIDKQEISTFVNNTLLNLIVLDQIEKEMQRRKPVAQRVQEAASNWKKSWFTSPIEAAPEKQTIQSRFKNALNQFSAWTAQCFHIMQDYVEEFGAFHHGYPSRSKALEPIVIKPATSATYKVIGKPVDDIERYEQWKPSKPFHPADVYNHAEYKEW